MNTGKNHRIDLIPFQGFLACLANTCRETDSDQDLNDWAMRDVINKPDSTMVPTVFPDGFAAKLVLLGDLPDITREPWKTPSRSLSRWWPQGKNDHERGRLLQRLQEDIAPLNLHLALALTLLAEMYLSPHAQGSTAPPLTTLRVAASPVSDFGLVYGACPGAPEHCYAFQYRDGKIERGADPAHHVWMYFQTADGHEYFLDMTLNLFNLGTYVEAKPFWQGQGEALTYVTDYVGMFWFDKRLFPADFPFYEERNRVSVLRSTKLAQVARYMRAVWREDTHMPQRIIPMTVTAFAQLLTGKEITLGDAYRLLKWAFRSMRRTRRMLDRELWKTWPDVPLVFAVDHWESAGPGIPMTPIDKDEYVERAKRYAARSRRASARERRGE